jgi:hypothetical protein
LTYKTANEAVDSIFSWDQEIIELIEPKNVSLLFQFFIDIGAIEHCVDKSTRFNYTASPFKFTLSFNNETMKQAFILQMTDNFEKFKMVKVFLNEKKNICSLYEDMASTMEFQTLKQNFKVLDKTFNTTDLIIWIKNRNAEFSSTFATELLGECLRQLKLYSIVKNGTYFDICASSLFCLTSEDDFQFVFTNILKSSNWNQLLVFGDAPMKKKKFSFFKSKEEFE